MHRHRHDCIVLGAGPAGLSAALWLARLGVEHVVLERAERLGGELPRLNLPVVDYLGLPAADGRDFLAAVERQLAARPPAVRFGVKVERIDPAARTLHTADGLWEARALILAPGLSRRRLEAPGVEEHRGRGVSYSATTDLARIEGQPVAVVGGGDGALENALLLAERCPRVLLLHRGAGFAARPGFVERVTAHPRIETRLQTVVTRVEGDGEALSAVSVAGPDGPRRLEVRWLVVKIGYAPNTGALEPGSLETDGQGYLVTDRWLRTSRPGVFAAGDVCNPRSPSISSAVGDGAVAAREAQLFLRQAG